ncbi:DUF378 domain-containing protein [Candidatus Peregrinibacteria bacterium]|nr:DUF378 domain-containing protein [Candidatus Peregrinibacteria bacterium]
MKHKPLCWIVSLLVFVGALNWGLVGIGGFLNMDLDLVNMLLGTWPLAANIVYLLVGIAAILFLIGFLKSPCCRTCEKSEATSAPAAPAEPENPAEGGQQ